MFRKSIYLDQRLESRRGRRRYVHNLFSILPVFRQFRVRPPHPIHEFRRRLTNDVSFSQLGPFPRYHRHSASRKLEFVDSPAFMTVSCPAPRRHDLDSQQERSATPHHARGWSAACRRDRAHKRPLEPNKPNLPRLRVNQFFKAFRASHGMIDGLVYATTRNSP